MSKSYVLYFSYPNIQFHKPGLEVIAEGVEQGEHEDILKQMQCDYGQGYFYSKPAAAEEINHWRQQYRSA